MDSRAGRAGGTCRWRLSRWCSHVQRAGEAGRQLQEESVEIAMSIAEGMVREKLTDDDHSRLKKVFIGAVEMEGSDV